jgi:hypothetical protein
MNSRGFTVRLMTWRALSSSPYLQRRELVRVEGLSLWALCLAAYRAVGRRLELGVQTMLATSYPR